MTKTKTRPGIESSALMAHIAEIRAHIDPNRPLDSLVEELALQKLAMQELRQSLAAMKALLRARDLILPDVKARYTGTRELSIDAGMPMASEMGFQSLETDAKGLSFRWTGPQASFFFDLHLDRSAPVKFSLQLIVAHGAASKNLRCWSEDQEVFLIKQDRGGTIEFSGLLPVREMIGVTRLEFIAEKTFKIAADRPTVGVAFHKLLLAPAVESEVREYLQSSRTPS